jgi:hypothetical protein
MLCSQLLRRLKQETYLSPEFKTNLGHIERPHLIKRAGEASGVTQ